MATPATSSRLTRAQARALGVDVSTPAPEAAPPTTARRTTRRGGPAAAGQAVPLAAEVEAAVRAAAATPVAQKLFSAGMSDTPQGKRAFGTPLHNTAKARGPRGALRRCSFRARLRVRAAMQAHATPRYA